MTVCKRLEKEQGYAVQGCKRDLSFETETRPRCLKVCSRRDLPRFSRDWDETETFQDQDIFRDVANGTAR